MAINHICDFFQDKYKSIDLLRKKIEAEEDEVFRLEYESKKINDQLEVGLSKMMDTLLPSY